MAGGETFTYFFKDGKYWKFNDKTQKIDNNSQLPFPRPEGKNTFDMLDTFSFGVSSNLSQ